MATSKSKTGRKIVVFTLILAVIGGLSWYAYFRKREVIITVQTEKVTRRNITEVVEATGKIQPVLMVKISPEVSGEIIELPVVEGQTVKKGDLLLKIKPDFYVANRNSAEASYMASQSNWDLTKANVDKADAEFKRMEQLFKDKLVSDSQYIEAKTALDVTRAQLKSAEHQTAVSKAALDRANDDLSKTTIAAPLNGTISKLNSQKGERVVGTATMAGTEVMTISDLNEMEARVDIGEIDVVLIKIGQVAKLEVDSYRDIKFNGEVTDIANTAKTSGQGTQGEATKFEVRIRLKEKEAFRPGMSVTGKIETRSRTNILTIPIQSVTTRLAKKPEEKKTDDKNDDLMPEKKPGKKQDETEKPAEVVFLINGEAVKSTKVKRGISDDNYVEITEGLTEGQQIVTGSYRAINRDLEDGKKILVDNQPKSATEKKP